jgi:hypothetical protein
MKFLHLKRLTNPAKILSLSRHTYTRSKISKIDKKQASEGFENFINDNTIPPKDQTTQVLI